MSALRERLQPARSAGIGTDVIGPNHGTIATDQLWMLARRALVELRWRVARRPIVMSWHREAEKDDKCDDISAERRSRKPVDLGPITEAIGR
jgi:hypothetical protein